VETELVRKTLHCTPQIIKEKLSENKKEMEMEMETKMKQWEWQMPKAKGKAKAKPTTAAEGA